MQITRLHPASQVQQSPQGVAMPAEQRAQEAPAAARPAQPEATTSNTRERLGALASSFGERLEHLAASEGLSGQQVDALKEAHMSFLQNLQRLSSAHASEDAPRQSMAQGLAAVKEALQSSVHQALSESTEDGGATAAERIAIVQQSVAERLGGMLEKHDLSPALTAAFQELAANFDGLLQRLGDAIDGGKLISDAKAGAAFANIMKELGESVHELMGSNDPSASGLYLPSGELSTPPMAGAQVEHLA